MVKTICLSGIRTPQRYTRDSCPDCAIPAVFAQIGTLSMNQGNYANNVCNFTMGQFMSIWHENRATGTKGVFLVKSKVQTILRLLILRIFKFRSRSEESTNRMSSFDLTLNIIYCWRNWTFRSNSTTTIHKTSESLFPVSSYNYFLLLHTRYALRHPQLT